jgi:uncharacterized membrane protein YphA (DoxX/SURF4 family)
MIRAASTVLARFLLSAMFLAAGINKIFHWHETEKMLMNVLCDWQSNTGFSSTAQECFGSLTPWAPLLLMTAVLFEMVGGVLLLLGIREKLGASLLLLFLIPVTILMHQFWFVEGMMREMQQIMFLKNLAIMGGLILVILHGAQAPTKSEGFSGSIKLP